MESTTTHVAYDQDKLVRLQQLLHTCQGEVEGYFRKKRNKKKVAALEAPLQTVSSALKEFASTIDCVPGQVLIVDLLIDRHDHPPFVQLLVEVCNEEDVTEPWYHALETPCNWNGVYKGKNGFIWLIFDPETADLLDDILNASGKQ